MSKCKNKKQKTLVFTFSLFLDMLHGIEDIPLLSAGAVYENMFKEHPQNPEKTNTCK